MDRNAAVNTLLSAVAQQVSTMTQLAQQQATTSAANPGLPQMYPSLLTQQQNLMLAASSINNAMAASIQQATVPQHQQIHSVFAPYLPAVAAAQQPSVDITQQMYYQPVLNTASIVCTCACNQRSCPVHPYESLPTPPALRRPYQHMQAPLVVQRQPQVVQSHQILQGRMPSASHQVPQLQIPQQTNLSQNTLSQHVQVREGLRLKRNQSNFSNDGRPSNKVRRVASIDDASPGSSQMEVRNIRRDFGVNTGVEASSSNYSRLCQTCFIPFGPSAVRAPCPCHNQPLCDESMPICRRCQENNAYAQQAATAAYLRRREQRQLENNFYRQNTYELPLAAANNTPYMFINNPRPLLDLLLFNTNDPLMYASTFQQQSNAQLLQQVLAQNPHIQEPLPVGATTDQIKKNTSISNYIKDVNVPENEQERCTVCLADFETGDDVRTLNCSHMFHIDCIDRWLVYNKKCPVCRVDMDKPGTFPSMIDYDEIAAETAAAS